ncbi:hypothetical protein GCM10010082_24970 [Kushneria pakistanensis]|uniref:Transposase n=1 Tax=Kushneria pakistanensis TaxID=1508770 RepID=A0ABQ3FM89_9GAMM|nr:hypothetical protein GCM10010082_24970 [Kushneria pakistanensis]
MFAVDKVQFDTGTGEEITAGKRYGRRGGRHGRAPSYIVVMFLSKPLVHGNSNGIEPEKTLRINYKLALM